MFRNGYLPFFCFSCRESRAQETHLVAYAGFAGFQAPVWAPKDSGCSTNTALTAMWFLSPARCARFRRY